VSYTDIGGSSVFVPSKTSRVYKIRGYVGPRHGEETVLAVVRASFHDGEDCERPRRAIMLRKSVNLLSKRAVFLRV